VKVSKDKDRPVTSPPQPAPKLVESAEAINQNRVIPLKENSGAGLIILCLPFF